MFIPLPEGARRVPMSEIEQPQAFERLAPPIATPDEAAPVPTLQSMLSTAELSRRPSRPPDHAAENRAMVALARELATSPEGILQKLAETALALCGAHSAGLTFWRRATESGISTGAPSPGPGLLISTEERHASSAPAARSWTATLR